MFAGNGNDNSGDGSGSPGDALSGGPSGDFDNLSDQMPTEMPTGMPTGIEEVVVTGMRVMIDFDFNQFANFVRDNRSNNAVDLAALASTLLVGTVPKAPTELRSLGQKKSEINPTTNQLSRLSRRTGNRVFRRIGRSAIGLAAGTASTLLLIGDGFFNIGIILNGAVRATSFSTEDSE